MPASESTPFINFWNPRTCHLFQWIVHSGQVPVDSLLDRAWEELDPDNESRSEAKDWFEMGYETSGSLRDSLAPILREFIADKLQELTGAALPMEELGYESFTDPKQLLNSSVDRLFFPMLVEAIREIDFGIVAETILRVRGKWNPEKNPPEIL
jgi:hypothetical protein